MWAESPDFGVCKMMEEHSAEVAVRQNLLDRLLDAVKQVRWMEGGVMSGWWGVIGHQSSFRQLICQSIA